MVKILVVEDSALMRTYLRRCLEKHGYEVDDWTPMSAMEVPEKVTQTAPDLVITDYLMGGCNGATVARMTQKVNPRIPVIVVTSSRDDEVVTALKKVNVNQILYKPITPEELDQAVKTALHSEEPA